MKKFLAFQRVHYIDSEKCIKKLLYITNTAGDEEYEKNETAHLNTVAFYIDSVSDLVVDGIGSVFIIEGKATNMALIDSENVVI